MTTRSYVLIIAGNVLLALSSPTAAHHGAAGLFDLSRTVEVTGSVKTWSFVNPHPILVLEVTDEYGAKTDWDIYFGPASAATLQRRDFASDMFKFGETLSVTGHPAKAEGVPGIDVFGTDASVTRSDGTRVP